MNLVNLIKPKCIFASALLMLMGCSLATDQKTTKTQDSLTSIDTSHPTASDTDPYPNPASEAATGWTPERYNTWVQSRAGTGEPVYWYSVGTLRAFPGGKLLYKFEGYDTGRAKRVSPTLTQQYSRKTYVYRDVETDDVITQVNGQAITPIAYPYQYITYEYKTDKAKPYLETMVEQGVAPNVRKIGPGNDITVRQIGNLELYNAPLFLDFAIPGQAKRYQTFENYDFIIPQDQTQPGMITFMRYGPLPEWAHYEDETGKVITQGAMHMTTWRIADYKDVPQRFRDYIEESAPLWQAPPKDLEDIRRLQSAKK